MSEAHGRGLRHQRAAAERELRQLEYAGTQSAKARGPIEGGQGGKSIRDSASSPPHVHSENSAPSVSPQGFTYLVQHRSQVLRQVMQSIGLAPFNHAVRDVLSSVLAQPPAAPPTRAEAAVSSTYASCDVQAAIHSGQVPPGMRPWLSGLVDAAHGRAESAGDRSRDLSERKRAAVHAAIDAVMRERPALSRHEVVRIAQRRARSEPPFSGRGPDVRLVREAIAERWALATETLVNPGYGGSTLPST